ncbi:HNH endonuclease family protein [Curtobacterium sp. MCBD17_040]|uniref:HNH endonuclease family protein n=1 Tax=Curtobacterium sp. MCBD17_040 TaxID=2175674 RepID=UPI000DA887D4|nr:HNH endonuclease family protein [Curtobacterium sp. MCBD17_040]WIB65509.1 HNH endonuclease family protein [Curtobacterium sp. MCBD17_040]
MGRKLLVTALALTVLTWFLISTGQWNTVVGSFAPALVAKEHQAAGAVHSAAPQLPSAPPKAVSDGAKQVADTLQHAGLTGHIADARTPSTAVHVLDHLTVTTTAPTRPYARAAFGTPWTTPADGCSVHNKALTLGLTGITFVGAPSSCVVAAGHLNDPYTGIKQPYTRSNPATVTVDAVVPLAWAWNNGADTWTAAKRAQFAADQTNLTVVSEHATDGKNSHGPAGWIPTDHAYICTYITRFVYIVHDYNLTVNASDQAVIRRDLAQC